MTNFLSKEEKKISNEFKKKGYVIRKIRDLSSLNKIRNIFVKAIKQKLDSNYKKKISPNRLFNYIHKKITMNKLNSFRLSIINEIKALK